MNEGRQYKTRQRRLILNYLASNRDRHLTAEDIINHFQTIEDKIGKSTVYRYLNLLLEKGLIRKYLREDRQMACYKYIDEEDSVEASMHLKCQKCGKLIDVSCQEFIVLKETLERIQKFKLDVEKTIFYGECLDCKKKEEIKK